METVTEGKVLIMEGLHLDPGLYLSEMSKLNALTFPYSAPPSRTGSDSSAMETLSSVDLSSLEEVDSTDLPRPLYIPIIVTSTNEDHRLLSRDAIYRTGSRFFEPQNASDSRLLSI